MEQTQTSLYPQILNFIEEITAEFSAISEERKQVLGRLTEYIQAQRKVGEPVRLNFICTHNSRRSHLSQIWAQVAAYFYGIENVQTYSGGTEATAFNPRAVRAIESHGIKVMATAGTENPVYHLSFAQDAQMMKAWSKIFSDQKNPKSAFGAVMTCSDADQNCPFIPGATRIALPFEDPKIFDDTPKEAEGYRERSRQIATEIFYAFSKV